MTLIIPELLPYTKLYGLYGPGFMYSLLGNNHSNPILAANYLPSPGIYSPQENVCLTIGATFTRPSTIKVAIINFTFHTSIGVYVVVAGCGFGPTGSANAYGCPLPSELSNIVYFETYYNRNICIRVAPTHALRLGVDISAIDLEIFANGLDISLSYTYMPFVFSYAGTGIPIPITITPMDIYSTQCLIFSQTSNKKTLNLNKSTGFIPTVT